MSQHELFVIDRKPQLGEKEAGRVASMRGKLTIANSLGLKAQAKSIKTDIATVERGCLITTPPMTDSELVIWRAWLPTACTDLRDEEDHKLADYNFDHIPSPVLNMWQGYKKSGLFERFEIWTPEKPRPDPILVGVNGHSRHLLARWGESDANLVSFDDIKRELVRRWYSNEDIGGEDWNETIARGNRTEQSVWGAGAAVAVSTFALVVLRSFLGVPPEFAFPIGAIIVAGIGISTFVYTHRQITAKVLKSSTLMQAITKDDSHGRDMYPATA